MRCRYTLLLILISACAYSQKADTLTPTYLNEVSVYAMPVTKYASGAKTEHIDLDGASSLNASVVSGTSVYFRNYGNEQLSSMAFRGTSASHTAVLWNGMNINSPTLGQTDFSLFPSYLLEEVSLQYGTASSLYGSDALGGSVLLGQRKPEFEKSTALNFHTQAGSFGRYFTGGKLQRSNERWVVRTKVMYRSIENNFRYYSPAVGRTKRQNNAAVTTYGADQQIHYKISNTKWISFEGLLTYNHREIQPPVTNTSADETLQDKNARFSLSYQGDHRAGQVFTSVGYITNNQLYHGPSGASQTLSNQVTTIINVDRSVGHASSFRYGVNASMFTANSDGYGKQKRENRYDGFVSFSHWFVPNWNVNVNMRQSLYARRYAPFSPSLGTLLKLITGEVHTVSVRSQASRGYRVPTLNDRYWTPGGNPDLKPEDARSIEGGITWRAEKKQHRIETELTGYKTKVDQWILWMPTNEGVWSPSNLQKVKTAGIEISLKYFLTKENFKIQSGLNYSYTRSKNLNGLSSSDRETINKQLPYVPYHLSNGYLKVSIKNWTGEAHTRFAGLCYTSLDNNPRQIVKGYITLNGSLSRKIDFTKCSIEVKGEINNILNTYYENMTNLAMPGRNYTLNLLFNFKNKQT